MKTKFSLLLLFFAFTCSCKSHKNETIFDIKLGCNKTEFLKQLEKAAETDYVIKPNQSNNFRYRMIFNLSNGNEVTFEIEPTFDLKEKLTHLSIDLMQFKPCRNGYFIGVYWDCEVSKEFLKYLIQHYGKPNEITTQNRYDKEYIWNRCNVRIVFHMSPRNNQENFITGEYENMCISGLSFFLIENKRKNAFD